MVEEPKPTLEERVAETRPTVLDKYVDVVVRMAEWLVKHWLGLLNLLFLIYVALPFLAPALMQSGAELPARIIYTIYRPACHQLPERSYFLFGESLVYDRPDLPADGVADSDNLFVRRNYIGDHEHGYKVAICHRDIAIYGSMFLMGLLFALRNFKLPPLTWKLYLLFLLPLAIDGLTQLAGLRESNWLMRSITGGLFGAATIWLVYPYLRDALNAEAQAPNPIRKDAA